MSTEGVADHPTVSPHAIHPAQAAVASRTSVLPFSTALPFSDTGVDEDQGGVCSGSLDEGLIGMVRIVQVET